jgi:hypothetical protein
VLQRNRVALSARIAPQGLVLQHRRHLCALPPQNSTFTLAAPGFSATSATSASTNTSGSCKPRSVAYEDWETRLYKAMSKVSGTLAKRYTVTTLIILFDRPYVLRNQLVHGGATWNNTINRAQVGDGTKLLGTLMLVFVDIMMDNPQRGWGKPFYPVVG